MHPIAIIAVVAWSALFAAGVVLLATRRHRAAGAAVIVAWLGWSAAGLIPCARQLAWREHASLNMCSPVWAALAPVQAAGFLYQRW